MKNLLILYFISVEMDSNVAFVFYRGGMRFYSGFSRGGLFLIGLIWGCFSGMNSSPAIAAPAGSTFTINVTWKCLTPTVVGNYPCRNSTEIIASYQGGLVYVRSAGIHCSNASKDRHNAFKLNIGKKSSGKILCKTPHYDGVIDYNGSVKRVSDGYTLDISGKYTTEFGGGYKKSRQSLSFTYRVQLKVEGRRCFGTKSWSFKGQINSVPGASGRYSYTTSKCSIGR